MNQNYNHYAPTVLRLGLGFLFIIPGFDKLMGMLSGGHMIAQMLGPGLAWLLLLVELICGISVLVGWNLKYTVWPLIAVMIGAIILVVIPSFGQDPMAIITLLFHLVAISGLLSLYFSGAGQMAVKQ